MTYEEAFARVRRCAMALPPSDFGSARAMGAGAEMLLAVLAEQTPKPQPIATAPRDGSEILVFMRERWYVAHWEYAPRERDKTPFWRSYELSIQACRKHQPDTWTPLPEAPK